MRWGLLTDIHEAVEPLRKALVELRSRDVDAFAVLGDLVDRGDRMDETIALLSPLPGIAVWGNHDFGLCGTFPDSLRARFAPFVLDYFSRLRGSAVEEGVRFQHIDPHLDPGKLEDLWSFPTSEERVAGLARCEEARIFVGHLHAWQAVTPQARLPWDGDRVLEYRSDQRYLTVVHAVVEGWCAVFDSDRDLLEPIRIA